MSIDNDGAKRLMAAILKQAYDDYTSEESCQPYCPMFDTCENKTRPSKEFCEAKKFIHSAWCASLCDGLEVDYQAYIEKSMAKCKITKNTVKYIEGELRAYPHNVKLIDAIKNDIILESPIRQEGKSYDVGNSTLSKTIRIENKIYTDKQLKRISDTINAIRNVYNRNAKEKREIFDNFYFNQRYTAEGMAYKLSIDRTTVYRWRMQLVYEVAKELNFL